MFFRVVFLRFREITLRVLHELSLGVLVAEAVGLSVKGRVDRAVRLDLLADGKTLRTHVVELAGGDPSR